MKFGKYLAKRHLDLPEYALYFLDYKAMKKLIKRLAVQPADDPSIEARHKRLQQNKATFFFQLERELEKVTSFYTQKEHELQVRLDVLVQKQQAAASGGMLGEASRASMAYIALHEGLQRFRRDLDRLEQFVELNATGFAKVLKKWDKQSRSHTKELYLSRAVEVQPMFHRDVLVALSDRSNACLLELESTNGSDTVASTTAPAPVTTPANINANNKNVNAGTKPPASSSVEGSASREALLGPVALVPLAGTGAPMTPLAPMVPLDAANDMFYEFVTFAETYTGGTSINPWIAELKAADLNQAFLRALPTCASDAALLALWKAGVDVHARDMIANRTSLHLCSLSGTSSTLTSSGTNPQSLSASVNATLNAIGSSADSVLSDGDGSIDGDAIAYWKQSYSRVPIFEAALRAGADVDAVDAYGRTPLISAVTHKRRDLLLQLLAAGADPNHRDHDNLTALHYAIFHSYLGCAEDLLDASAQTSNLDSEKQYVPLNFACQYGKKGAVELLLRKRGSDKMIADAEGLFPLHIVARAGYGEIIPILVEAGARVDEKDKLNGWTPLMYAAAEGHSTATCALLDAGADQTILDEKDRSALFFAAWEGHSACFKVLAGAAALLKKSFLNRISESSTSPATKVSETSSVEGSTFVPSLEDLDLTHEIPDLELPPPIMPLKRYGHTFLDPNTIIVQIRDVQVHMNDRRGLRAGRLTLTSSSTRDYIPRNLILPIKPHDHVQTFEVGDLSEFSITFDVMPVFGTRPLARTVASTCVFSGFEGDGEQGRHVRLVNLPLLDLMLRPAGVLEFTFLVVKPFPGKPLDISKYYTYWKSTAEQGSGEEEKVDAVTTLSYVTASSLHGSYRQVVVTLTRDLVPVIADLHFDLNGIEIATPLLTLDELLRLRPGTQKLSDWLSNENTALEGKYNIHVPFPTLVESREMPVRWPAMNTYVDHIIAVVFSYVRHTQNGQHGIVFSSTHPEICAMFNWKQPNFPVLFWATAMRADGIYTTANRLLNSTESLGELAVCKSLREASIYAATNHIMGIVAPSDVLSAVPAVIPAIRQTGLVLISDGEPVEGTDGVLRDHKLEFPKDIGM